MNAGQAREMARGLIYQLYQHTTTEASRLIADSISGTIDRAQGADGDGSAPA